MKCRLLLISLVLICPIITHAQARYARVIAANANLRDTPSINSSATQEVAEETLVKVLDEKLPWYIVRIGNRVGWMHGDALEFVNVSSPSPSEQLPRQQSSPREQSILPVTPSAPPISEHQGTRSTSPHQSSTTPSHSDYIRGSRGGCYYISGSGRKVYVDRSMCN